jgi:sulfur relay protein TusB/DsrH
MAILHIIPHLLTAHALHNLVERSDVTDAYVFIDDGVYVLLSNNLLAFKGAPGTASRSVFVMADHVIERGITLECPNSVTLIDMADLVSLTASYPSSMSW